MANDTQTTLNPGTGGDVMDETLATRADGTQAKRPRVVLGTDGGPLVGRDTGEVALPTRDDAVLEALNSIDQKLGTIIELLASFAD